MKALKNTKPNPSSSVKKETNKSVQILLQLVESKEANNHILEWGGRLALENKAWSLGERIFSSLLERRKKTEDLMGLAQALLHQKRMKEAEECLLEALNYIKEPCLTLFLIYKNLGDIYLLSKDLELAEEYYNKAYTINPHSSSLQFQIAYLKLKSKNFLSAEASFKKLIKNHPHCSKFWLGLALSRRHLNESQLALACLYRCLDLDPHNSFAINLQKKWTSPSFSTNHVHFSFSS